MSEKLSAVVRYNNRCGAEFQVRHRDISPITTGAGFRNRRLPAFGVQSVFRQRGISRYYSAFAGTSTGFTAHGIIESRIRGSMSELNSVLFYVGVIVSGCVTFLPAVEHAVAKSHFKEAA